MEGYKVVMKKKSLGAFLTMVFLGMVYFVLNLACIAEHNSISSEDYARMSRDLVEQSIQEK